MAAIGRPSTAGHGVSRPRPPTAEQLRLRAALVRALRAAGPQTGVAVYDLQEHRALVAIRDGVMRLPASIEKLYTTVAAAGKLGLGARLRTTVLGAGRLGPAGLWRGDLYLRGAGDPTFGDQTFNRIWERGYGPTAGQLARRLRTVGIRRVTGAVIPDPSLFDSRPGGPSTGFAPDTLDYGGQLSALTYDHGATSPGLAPAAFAAKQLAMALRAAGVQAQAAQRAGVAPHGARRLAAVPSPPLPVLIGLMNLRSDDLFADLLTEQLGARFAQAGSIAAGARVIAGQVAADYGLHPKIADGSGLSRADRSSPREVITLLRLVWRTPIGHALSASLPIVGVNGTTRRIAKQTMAQGHCIAKTGTLNNITNLAGYCHRPGGHMLAFAIFLDGPTNERALGLLGHMVTAIASY